MRLPNPFFRISLQWSTHIINLVDKTKLSWYTTPLCQAKGVAIIFLEVVMENVKQNCFQGLKDKMNCLKTYVWKIVYIEVLETCNRLMNKNTLSKLKLRLKVCSCLHRWYRAPLKSTFYMTKLEHQILHEINNLNKQK